MHAWLPFVLLFAAPQSSESPIHKVDVHLAGPLAMVEVWRTVEANTRTIGARRNGTFLDLALPDGAALLDWEMIDRAGRIRLEPQSEVQVSAGLAVALKMRQLAMPAAPAEEGTAYRLHITPIADGEKAVLHYRYATMVGCKSGQLVLRMPENLEENPLAAEVTVTIEPSPDGLALAEASLASRPAEIRPGAHPLVLRGTSPARAAWEIAWRYAKTLTWKPWEGFQTLRPGPPDATTLASLGLARRSAPSEALRLPTRLGSFPGQVLAAAARVPRIVTTHGRTKTVMQYELAGLLCRDDALAKSEPPARVLLLLDRSRSVGPGGISAERALARALIEALPPSVQFNGVPFGVEATPVFTLPRIPTREALEAFANAADPNRLENGTDVVQALARARAMVEAGGADGVGPTWLVLLTDGALPSSQTAENMQKVLAGGRDGNLKVLVLLVRQAGDEDVPASAVAEYVRFARKFGGMVRVIPTGNAAETANGILAAMARGGDLLDVRLESGKLAEVLSPGRGASLAFNDPARLPRDRRVRVSARALDAEVRAETTPALVKREWLDPLVETAASARRAWSGANTNMTVAILPPPVQTNKPSDGVVRGRMDPTVLRNALSLAFMPRARACYLSRRVAKADDVYLRGRIKLELSIERGELHDAVVRSSTLGHPDIENCVRSAAWAVEYPRPEHRDAPTTANVNLVFQPRTAQEAPPDASPLDREIELILGPLTLTADFTDLIESKAPDKLPAQ
jgi:hypothetical protein